MNDYQRIEKAAAAREARDAAGRAHARGPGAEGVDAALMRYLAAAEYHEEVEEAREKGEKGEAREAGKETGK